MSLATPHGFNREIHGARGLFSAMVFVYHVYHSGLPTFPAIEGSWLEVYGLDPMKFGVELFFGISGMVIFGALHRAASPGAFLWDRIARIMPTLWAALLVITAVYLLTGRPLPSPGLWAANFLAPPPFFDVPMVHPAAWSLGYEFTLYGLCALAWAMRGAGVRGWLPFAWLIGGLLVVLFPRSILMMAGIGIAAGIRWPRWIAKMSHYPGLLMILFLVTWRMIDIEAGSRIRLMSPLHPDPLLWASLFPFIILSGVIGGMALLGIERGHGKLGGWLRLPVMQWLGTISYSFYLWHPVCMGGIKFFLIRSGLSASLEEWNQIVFALLALPPSLLVSHWSQQVLEVRATHFLRRWRSHRCGERLTPAVAAHDMPSSGERP